MRMYANVVINYQRLLIIRVLSGVLATALSRFPSGCSKAEVENIVPRCTAIELLQSFLSASDGGEVDESSSSFLTGLTISD